MSETQMEEQSKLVSAGLHTHPEQAVRVSPTYDTADTTNHTCVCTSVNMPMRQNKAKTIAHEIPNRLSLEKFMPTQPDTRTCNIDTQINTT